jgi:hypothetical protein
MAAKDEIAVGTKVRFSHNHLFQRISFSARVVKVVNDKAWVEMPERVRRLPFPPLGGKRYGLFPISALQTAR